MGAGEASYLRRVKDETIAKGYVPVQITQLNQTIKDSKVNKIVPPKWGMDGRKAIMSMDKLKAKFDAHSKQHINKAWTDTNTRDALWDEKRERAKEKGLDPDDVKQPDKASVDSYHSALMCDVEMCTRKAAHLSIHRQAATTSPRAMLSNLSGALASFFFVDANNSTPTQYRFDPNTATPGEILARSTFAEAAGVPVECVQPVYRALHLSIDDMAVYYGDFNKNLSNEANRDVRGIVSKTQLANNPRFGVHTEEAPSLCLSAIKVRPTNMLIGNGQYGPIFWQLLLKEDELPADKVPDGF